MAMGRANMSLPHKDLNQKKNAMKNTLRPIGIERHKRATRNLSAGIFQVPTEKPNLFMSIIRKN
jgi:hypothetical protein